MYCLARVIFKLQQVEVFKSLRPKQCLSRRMVAEVNRQVNDWMDNCIDGWGNEQTDERLEGGLIYGLIRNLLIGDWLINWFISRLINRLIEKKKGGESTNTLNLMWGWLSVRRLLCLPCVAVKSLKRKKERHRDNLNYFSVHIHLYFLQFGHREPVDNGWALQVPSVLHT